MENEVFDNQPTLVRLSRVEVLVRFDKDENGTLSITYDPDEMLTDEDRVIHFLDNPVGDKEFVVAKTNEIIDHYNLHEYTGAIKLESNGSNPIYFCGRLCEELLIHKFDCTKEECTNMREDVENKIKRLKDPRILDELRNKYPNVKVMKIDSKRPQSNNNTTPSSIITDDDIIVSAPSNNIVVNNVESKTDISVSTNDRTTTSSGKVIL